MGLLCIRKKKQKEVRHEKAPARYGSAALRCGFAFKHKKTQACTEEFVKDGTLKLIVSKVEQDIHYDGMANSDPARLDFIHSPWEAVVEYYGKEKLLEINTRYEKWQGKKTAER